MEQGSRRAGQSGLLGGLSLPLLALKVEEGAMSQGTQAESKETLFVGVPRKNTALLTPRF